jgi:type II secretory pathway pseudopilin PulG
MNRSRRTAAGTSLVEILVVIVVFLIGILAIVQIFPGGFRLLGLTRSQSQATYLARTEIDRLKSRPNQLPDRVVPVRYLRSAGDLVAIVDSNRRTNELGPTADGLLSDGTLTLNGDNLGLWRRASASNMVNRIVGESTIIPAPRNAAGAINDPAFYGGLMNLQFGPAMFNAEVSGNSADNDVVFNVYGNDLSLALGQPPAPGIDPFRPHLYYCDNADTNGATLYIPQAGTPIRYRFAATAYVRDAANNVRTVELLDYIATVPAGGPNTYFVVPLNTVFVTPIINAGDTFIGVAFDSLQLAPLFDRIPKANNFTPDYPYEYKLIDDVNGATNANMGSLLFNPAGYKFYVPSSEGRRVPLTARVNYNVYDWGIVRQDIRVPNSESEAARLVLGSLKVKGNMDTDGRTYQGLGLVVPTGAGASQELDFVVLDTETGGIYAYNPASLDDPNETSYRVDRSIGSIRFQDRNTATPELEVTLYRASDWAPVQIDDARGRSIRVLYQSSQEYQVQVLKAAARYIGVSGTPGSGQCALGLIGDPVQGTRLYFSNSDLGRSIAINEAFITWDLDGPGPGATTEVRKVSVSGTIKAPVATDPIQLPYFDLVDVYGTGWTGGWSAVDETGKSPGYAIRGVRGASVAVRVLWNPQKFSLTGSPAANMTAFDRWASNWRKATTETFLQKGGGQ